VDYSYALRGDGQPIVTMIDGQTQRKAFHSLMKTLDIDALTLPEHILKLIPPREYGAARHRELFDNRTGPTVDPLAMAEAAADQTLSLLLHPARASRLVEQHARDAGIPGLDPVLQLLVRPNIEAELSGNLNREVHRVINERVVQHLIQLAADTHATPQVRAITTYQLNRIMRFLESDMLKRRTVKIYNEDVAHYQHLAQSIRQFLEAPEEFTQEPDLNLPPGSPIGDNWCSFNQY
jgi:Met-zincin